jgi:hypothetical protein
MSSIRLALAVLVGGSLMLCAPVFAADRGALQKGLLLIQAEKFEEAALAWQADGDKLMASGDDAVKSDAGVRYVLATIAFDKASDARAYGTWAKAIEIFLRTGGDWITERDRLQTDINESRAALVSVLNGETANLKTNGADLSLVNIDALVGLTKFDGPRRNLKTIEVAKAEDIEGGRAYIARPLALKAPASAATKAISNSDEPIEEEDAESVPEPESEPEQIKGQAGTIVVPLPDEDDEIQRLRRAYAPVIKRAKRTLEPTAQSGAPTPKANSEKRGAGMVAPVRRVIPTTPQLKGSFDQVDQASVPDADIGQRRGVPHGTE